MTTATAYAIGDALGFTPGECDLLRETLRAEYERGRTEGVRKAWDESQHPRDHGKFSEKPGGKGEPKTDRRGFLVQEGEPLELRTWSNIPRDEMVTLRPQLKRGKWSWGVHETKPVKSWDDTELAEHLGEPAVAGADKAKRSAILARTSLHDNKGRDLTPGELWAAGLPGGHAPPAPEQDWRPDETVPEDYYAAGDDATAHQTGEEWRQSLTAEERKEVGRFQGGGFAMQKDLRSGSPDATTLSRAALMDSAIAKSPGLRADSTLYRGLDFDTPQQAQQFLAGKQVGDEFTDLGYGSTSVDEAYIKTFWRGNEGPRSVRVDVRAPEGTAGAYMSEGGASHLEHEREFLLARGARYRVNEVRAIGDGGTHLVLSLLGTGEKKAFDPSQDRDAHGRWTADPAGDTVTDAPKPDRSITHRDLSDEQRAAIAEMARLFPDGVHHLLHDDGRIDEARVLGTGEDETTTALHEKADQLRGEWHEVDASIREKLKYADQVEAYDIADDALNTHVNATLFNGDFDSIKSGERFREEDAGIADALDAIGEGLGFVDAIPYGERPWLPPEEEYTFDPDAVLTGADQHETAADMVADYEKELDEHQDRLGNLTADLDGAKEKGIAASKEFRGALERELKWLGDCCADALKIPTDDWDDIEGGTAARGRVEDLAARVRALQPHFGVVDKAFDPNEARDESGKWTKEFRERLTKYQAAGGTEAKAFDPGEKRDDHSHELLAAMVRSVSNAVEAGEDAEAAAEVFRELIDDPTLLAEVVAGTVGKALRWDRDKHPRDKSGKFISRDRIAEAKTDRKKAAKLFEEVKPEDAQKLTDALTGVTDLGRTQAAQRKEESAARREAKKESKKRADRLIRKLVAGKLAGKVMRKSDLHALAKHLPHMTVADLRQVRRAIGASFRGDTKKLHMVERLVAFSRGEPEPAHRTRSNRSDSIIAKIQAYGGIDPTSHELKKTYGTVKDAVNDNVPLAVFRKGGVALDVLAQTLADDGYIRVPGNMDAGEYVLDMIRNRANTLAADQSKEYDEALDEYYRTQQEIAQYEDARSVEAEALRRGEEDARGEVEKDPVGEYGESPDEVDDFDPSWWANDDLAPNHGRHFAGAA